MNQRFRTVSGMGILMLLCNESAAFAQPAESPASVETGLTSPDMPPSPGFITDLVFGGSLEAVLQQQSTARQNSKPHATVFTDSDLRLFANYQNWLSLATDMAIAGRSAPP